MMRTGQKIAVICLLLTRGLMAATYTPFGGGVSSWTLTEQSATKWTAVPDAADQVAELVHHPVDPTYGNSLAVRWYVVDADPAIDENIGFEMVVPQGLWAWSDARTSDIYNFTPNDNTWRKSDNTDVWLLNRTTNTWTQTIGGSDIWSYDEANARWLLNPAGAAVAWTYDVTTDRWTHVSSASTWAYNPRDVDWGEVTSTGTTGLTMPAEPVRQQQMIRFISRQFFMGDVFGSGPTTGITFTSNGDGTWAGAVTSEDQTLAYDSTTTGLTLTMENSSTVPFSNGTLTWQHNPATGAWQWQHGMQLDWVESWEFDSTANEWTDAHSGEVWTYTPLTKTWSKESVEWQHDYATNRWTNTPGDKVWEYDATNGQWTYDPDGVPWVFTYNFLADVWYQVTENEGSVSPMPPRVVAQKAVIDSAYEALRLAGGFAVSGPFGWQTVTSADGVWSAPNAAGTETVTYTPGDAGFEVVWQTDDALQKFSYNINTSAWWWRNDTDPDDHLLWDYDATTKRWSLDGSDEYWQFTPSTRTWQNSEETISWQYQPANGTWKSSLTLVEWLFSPTNNTWTNQTNGAVWRYDLTGRSWQVIANAPDPLPVLVKLPPEALVQQELVSYAVRHMRTAGAFSTTGPFGWTLTAQGDGSWAGSTAAADEQLIYDPARTPYMIRNRNTGDEYAQQDTLVWEYDINGDWRVTQSVDPAAVEETSFVANTGVWTAADGTTPWRWQTTPTTRWHETATERTWTFDEVAKQWTDSVSNHVWSYVAATGVWTDHTATLTWKYDALAETWTQLSGDSVTAENMPPLPVIQRALFSHIFEVVALKGVFVTVTPLTLSLTAGDDAWQWSWQREGANDSMSYDGALTGTNRVKWDTIDNSRTWRFDPATGDWSWTTVDIDAASHTWTYTAATKTWQKSDASQIWEQEAGLIWRNKADANNAWQYDPVAQQWTNLATDSVWGYYASIADEQENDVIAWTNITNATAWLFDEQEQRWVQTAGYPDITDDLPPEPVRQMTLIHVAWQGMLAQKVLAAVSPHNASGVTRQINGTWTAAGNSADVVYDASNETYHVTAQAGSDDTRDWAVPLKQWRYGMAGNWQVLNHTDPLVSSDYGYDATTQKWGRITYTGGVTWSFDPAAVSWTNDTTSEVWQYASGTWTDVANSQTWTYSTATNLWTHGGSSRTWRFASPSDQWEEVGDSGSALTMPPRVVVAHEMIWQMQRVMVADAVFHEYPQVTWQADEHDWHAVGTKNNAQARYNPRHTYQVSWRDTHTQNTAQYSTTTNDWIWRADNQHWRYNAAAGLWGRDTRTPSSCWAYQSGDTPSWTNQSDETEVWTQGGSAYTWTDSASSTTWVYDPAAATWTLSATGAVWTYSFATGAWVEVSATRIEPAVFPPLPLVQQLFINALAGSVTTFFDNPLYAAAQTKPSAQHPLFGTRPLEKGKIYGRYNASSVLINAGLTLDHVTWVHNDVSRNHGKTQLPSITTAALPAIIGGERAAQEDRQWAPSITLYDSCIACHESLVSAGVRWRVTDRPLSGENSSLVDAHNSSSIMGYNRGRKRDMPLGRGTVFQLGSTANRMADGTITSSIQTHADGSETESSLRDAYIDIYRAQATLGATSNDPSVIDLALKTAFEDGESTKERAYQVLQLAHESRVSVGWPVPTGDSGYTPYNFTAANLAALQDAEASTLFSAGQTGGGSLSVSGHHWYIGARDASNYPPRYPIKQLDQDGVVYVDHGGLLRATGSYDLILDTVVAHRLGATPADAGRVEIDADQLILGVDGFIQPYDIDFAGLAHTSGPLSGHVPFSAGATVGAIGRPLHGTGLEKVK